MEKATKEDFDPLFVAEKAARLLLEENGAEAVVILWTSQRRRKTRFWRHQIGNSMLCNALVENACEDQVPKDEEEDDE